MKKNKWYKNLVLFTTPAIIAGTMTYLVSSCSCSSKIKVTAKANKKDLVDSILIKSNPKDKGTAKQANINKGSNIYFEVHFNSKIHGKKYVLSNVICKNSKKTIKFTKDELTNVKETYSFSPDLQILQFSIDDRYYEGNNLDFAFDFKEEESLEISYSNKLLYMMKKVKFMKVRWTK